jgi:hypothetical protein
MQCSLLGSRQKAAVPEVEELKGKEATGKTAVQGRKYL